MTRKHLDSLQVQGSGSLLRSTTQQGYFTWNHFIFLSLIPSKHEEIAINRYADIHVLMKLVCICSRTGTCGLLMYLR